MDIGRDNVEDMSVVEMFLEEVGLEEGQKHEVVSIIKGMGELLTCFAFMHLHFMFLQWYITPMWGTI